MSYQDGWAAINLEMPPRVPRTEYSAESYHWPLIRKVTGLEVTENSPAEEKKKATLEFMKKWQYDFFWNILITHEELGEYQTNMGHAEYASDGSDLDEDIHQLFDDPEDILSFQPMEKLGKKDKSELTRRFNENYRSSVEAHPDGVNMTGTYISLISGLLALFGWDTMLLAAGVDQKRFGELATRYTDWMLQYYEAIAESEAPIIMTHDDIVWTSGPFISPEWYRKYLFPNYKRLFAPIKEAGKKIAYTSDGNYTMFVDDLVDTGIDGFIFEPMTDLKYIAENYGKTHFFIGNADTRILLNGTKEAIKAEVERCINIGKSCPGFFMAVGNHIPANTPVENALYYNECYERMMRR